MATFCIMKIAGTTDIDNYFIIDEIKYINEVDFIILN